MLHIKDNRDKTAADPTSLMTPSALAVLNEGDQENWSQVGRKDLDPST